MALCNTAEVPKCLNNGKNIFLFFLKVFWQYNRFDSQLYIAQLVEHL